ISTLLAKAMNLSEYQTKNLHMAAMMHDIGKIGVADSILKKPGHLCDEEYNLQVMISETKEAEIEIVVRDNGLGLPDAVDIHQVRSVGLYLVNGLVKNQLDGQMEVRRDNGTEFRITFPCQFR
ncbi:MAG: ATP-binding protein, partial [Lentisphaerota bacterium]